VITNSSRADEARLLAQRTEFPSLAQNVYLMSHTLGAMPRKARAYAQQFLDGWEAETFHTLEREWIPTMTRLAETIARVLGAAANTVTVLPNCSTALAVIASALPVDGARRRVVYDDLNFTTVHNVWQAQARHGVEVEIVPSRDGIAPPIEDILAAIDERTLVVPISHVQFRNAAAYDVPRIVERAHEVGALVFLDCYQSAGIVPVELARWGVDLACGGSIKWACGGPGVGYLYVHPALAPRLEPTMTGWLAHAEPFAFDLGPMRYAQGPWRFAGGVPAIPSMYTALAGWEAIDRLGVEAIRAKSLRQTALVREHALRRGCAINTPVADDARGGTMTIDFPGAQDACGLLQARRFLVDHRPRGGMRISPHFYTTDDEIEAFFAEFDLVRASL
jgi:kynureninase